MVMNMWLLNEVIITRNVNPLFFVIEFLIGIFALSIAVYLKRKDALLLFTIGAIGNMLLECIGLATGCRIYGTPAFFKPFIIISIGLGEAGAAMCFTWLIVTWIWLRVHR